MAKNNGSGSNNIHGENSASFEQSFLRLQEVVQHLSDGNLTLQEALAAFEEGMALAGKCSTMLEEAELRVKQISERAMQAGTSSVAGLTSPAREEAEEEAVESEPELVSFEVETFEGILFDARPRQSRESKQSRHSPTTPEHPEELDPLFDEDD